MIVDDNRPSSASSLQAERLSCYNSNPTNAGIQQQQQERQQQQPLGSANRGNFGPEFNDNTIARLLREQFTNCYPATLEISGLRQKCCHLGIKIDSNEQTGRRRIGSMSLKEFDWLSSKRNNLGIWNFDGDERDIENIKKNLLKWNWLKLFIA